ncbi:hypothetical protein PVK06_002570 [Gossypium arboreum]|uniref:Uncharacterized protein n=1 Tax=Gossypium arboreum TaxID=29729 RepID=A0ABR0R517_GOSAR|nr:hypothetical protein PVK06_002570 [Gossypium arboreum]
MICCLTHFLALASLGLLDACLRSTLSFVILGLTPSASFVPASQERGSLAGLAILSANIACDLVLVRLNKLFPRDLIPMRLL